MLVPSIHQALALFGMIGVRKREDNHLSDISEYRSKVSLSDVPVKIKKLIGIYRIIMHPLKRFEEGLCMNDSTLYDIM